MEGATALVNVPSSPPEVISSAKLIPRETWRDPSNGMYLVSEALMYKSEDVGSEFFTQYMIRYVTAGRTQLTS